MSTTKITAWNSSSVYYYGDEVTEEGGVWEANWYNVNDNPLYDTTSGVWTLLSPPNPHPAAPDAPTAVQAAYASDSAVTLSWTAAIVPGTGSVTSYDVYANGVKIGATSSTTFSVSGLLSSTTYKFTVDAVDATGTSPQSAPLTVTTAAPSISSGKVFSPYIDMGLTQDENVVALVGEAGLKAVTLAFIQSSGSGTVGWSGTGTIDSDGFPDNPSLPNIQQQVQTLQAEGVQVTLSIGGEAGTDPAMVATSAAELQAEYQSIVDRYDVTHLDFDIEGAPINDQASITLRDQALVGLEKANPGLQISYTLPVLPTGLDDNGVNVLRSAAADGVKLSVVNIMAMDYGSPTVDNDGAMGADAITAAKATEQQLPAGMTAKIGITPMIGMNDDTQEIFSLADAEEVEAFAAATPWVASIGMWSLARDNGSGAGAKYTSDDNSSIAQTPFEFSSIFDALNDLPAGMGAPVGKIVEVTGQPYSAYETVYNAGTNVGTDYFYTDLAGEPYSASEHDYSAGHQLIGSRYLYTNVPTGADYAAYEHDYNGQNQLTRTAFFGVTGKPYSSYEYDYIGGIYEGAKYTYTSIPSGAAYSSYELDYNAAHAYVGKKFFYTDLTGRTYTGEEQDYDASGKLSRVLLTGCSEPYYQLEQDYKAGTYEGYKAYYAITGKSYTNEEIDATASGQIEKVIFSGMTSTPYSSHEEDYAGGAVTQSIYGYTDVTGQNYYAYQVTDSVSGKALSEVFDLTSGGHAQNALASGQTLTSQGNDIFTGSAAGATTFALDPLYGADTITNLTSADTVSMSKSEFASFSALMGAAKQSGANVVITASDGDTLTLKNETLGTLSAMSASFAFHA